MAYKKDRQIKVYEGTTSSGYGYSVKYKSHPQIRLQGDWLDELGFHPGPQMNVHCEEGKLIITASDSKAATS